MIPSVKVTRSTPKISIFHPFLRHVSFVVSTQNKAFEAVETVNPVFSAPLGRLVGLSGDKNKVNLSSEPQAELVKIQIVQHA